MKTFDEELLRAAELLEEDAEALRGCHTLNGAWIIVDDLDRAAQRGYEERIALAKRFRALGASIH